MGCCRCGFASDPGAIDALRQRWGEGIEFEMWVGPTSADRSSRALATGDELAQLEGLELLTIGQDPVHELRRLQPRVVHR